MGRSGFEPLKSKDDGFTVRCIWPLCNLPKLNPIFAKFPKQKNKIFSIWYLCTFVLVPKRKLTLSCRRFGVDCIFALGAQRWNRTTDTSLKSKTHRSKLCSSQIFPLLVLIFALSQKFIKIFGCP